MSTRTWFAVIALGRDRPGIVADLSGCIFECGYNLENASMSQLGHEFAVLMLASGHDSGDDHRGLAEATKRLEWEKNLTVFLRRLDGEPSTGTAKGARPIEVRAVGVDRAGIVARVSRCLADHAVDIEDLRGSVSEAAQSGTPVYTLMIRAAAERAVDLDALQRDLEVAAEQLDVEISLSPQQS